MKKYGTGAERISKRHINTWEKISAQCYVTLALIWIGIKILEDNEGINHDEELNEYKLDNQTLKLVLKSGKKRKDDYPHLGKIES